MSLLIGELAYGAGTDVDNHVKIGVLLGSGTAALLAAVILRIRDRHHRTIRDQDAVDDDRDGVPDGYQNDDGHERYENPTAAMVAVVRSDHRKSDSTTPCKCGDRPS